MTEPWGRDKCCTALIPSLVKRRVIFGPPSDDDERFDVVKMRQLIVQATEADSHWRYEVGRALVDAHDPPETYFYREGWAPRGHFS